jgi:hypothetical protein
MDKNTAESRSRLRAERAAPVDRRVVHTPRQIASIIDARKDGVGVAELARRFHTHEARIRDICKGLE